MRNTGFWGGIILLIYSITMFFQSFSLKYSAYGGLGPGSGFFPLWLNGLLTILSLVFIAGSFKQPTLPKDILPHGQGLANVLSTLGAVLLFILIARTTGFVIASTLMLFIVLTRQFNWRKGLLISFTTTLVLLIIFQYLLEVPLPVNEWGW